MKILIIRLGSLGDVVLTTPVLEILGKTYPEAELHYLVKKEFSQILEGNPHLKRIIPFENKGEHKGLRGLLKIIEELKEQRYTHVLDLHANLRSRIISGLLWGTQSLRYNKQAIKRRLLLRKFKVNTKHTVEAYQDALLPLGISAKPGSPRIYCSNEEIETADKYLIEKGIQEGATIIGISPGAKWPTKMWPEDHFTELGEKIVSDLGANILVVGGADERELSERIAEKIGDHCVSIAGKTNIRESAALISRCNLFITNDSGPMHMATAVEVPVVAIFGPTVRGFGFSPLGKSVVIEKKLGCRPCSLHGSPKCPKEHFDCMKLLDVEDVFKKTKNLLNKSHENT